ncbi:MAG: alkaline phosphatase [Planctomycetaceae bacterium]|jgi:alkaline phosphatase|nr:alkaline phosphatase [Planctomycetaceae bacterium]
MTKKIFTKILFLTIYVFFFVAVGNAQTAKNVILLIGDGNGFNSECAGTYYRYGENGKQRYQTFPVVLGCTTYSRTNKDVELPADVTGYDPKVFWETAANGTQGTEFTKTTDSAASSTAIHGGVKTSNGKIGMTYDKKPIELISEIAVKHGKKTGTVTTVPMSHATPAGFSAHESERGDLSTIFLQMVSETSPLSVVMGCGHPFYEHGNLIEIKDNEDKKAKTKRFSCVGNEKNWETMKSGTLNGFRVIETKKQFEELAAGKGVIPDKVIGVVRSLGDLPPVDGALDDVTQTKELLNKNYKNTDWNELPSLSTMSLAALNVLTRNNPNGFILMIEGGAIDHAHHGRNIVAGVLEHTGFSKTIDTVIDWVEKNSSWNETLVIITADHETGQIWGPETFNDDNNNGVYDEGDSFNKFRQVQNNGRGKVPGVQYSSSGHTNALVPLYAKGIGADLFLKKIKGTDQKAAQFWNFSGQYVDDTDIFHVIKTVIVP